jgi:hypothetical protein
VLEFSYGGPEVVCSSLAEHGYGSPEEFPEVAVLRSRP